MLRAVKPFTHIDETAVFWYTSGIDKEAMNRMKRIGAMLCAVCLLLGLCACGGQTPPAPVEDTSNEQPYYPEEAVPVVVPTVEFLENGDVNVTVHAGLLLNGESEELSEEQIKDGYLSAVRNEDQSVTYTIAGDRFEEASKKVRDDCRYHIVEGTAAGSFESVYAAEVNEDFSFVKCTAESVGYNPLDAAEACFQTAILTMRAQTYDPNAPGTCEVIVVDETTGAVHERHIYPDELTLFPAE